jgi:hypothetical protein
MVYIESYFSIKQKKKMVIDKIRKLGTCGLNQKIIQDLIY